MTAHYSMIHFFFRLLGIKVNLYHEKFTFYVIFAEKRQKCKNWHKCKKRDVFIYYTINKLIFINRNWGQPETLRVADWRSRLILALYSCRRRCRQFPIFRFSSSTIYCVFPSVFPVSFHVLTLF